MYMELMSSQVRSILPLIHWTVLAKLKMPSPTYALLISHPDARPCASIYSFLCVPLSYYKANHFFPMLQMLQWLSIASKTFPLTTENVHPHLPSNRKNRRYVPHSTVLEALHTLFLASLCEINIIYPRYPDGKAEIIDIKSSFHGHLQTDQ